MDSISWKSQELKMSEHNYELKFLTTSMVTAQKCYLNQGKDITFDYKSIIFKK